MCEILRSAQNDKRRAQDVIFETGSSYHRNIMPSPLSLAGLVGRLMEG
jgi:hypothetical protein